MTGASSGVFGASLGVTVTPNQVTLHFVRVCVLIFYVLFREPQLLHASSDRGDSDGAEISRKVEQKMTGASTGVFGASSGVLVTPNQETLHFVRVCVLIFYVLFREPQLLHASSDRGDFGGAGKLSKS